MMLWRRRLVPPLPENEDPAILENLERAPEPSSSLAATTAVFSNNCAHAVTYAELFGDEEP